MKRIFAIAILSLSIAACNNDPQDLAEKKAEEFSKQAESEAAAADAQLNQSIDNANASAVHATQAELNKAMGAVDVPELKGVAKTQVEKLGKDALDFVNSNDYNNAQKYADRINEDLKKVNDLEAKGRITKEDADKIRDYGKRLAESVQLNINVILITPAEESVEAN